MRQLLSLGGVGCVAVVAGGLAGCGPAPYYDDDVPQAAAQAQARGSLFGRWKGVGHQNNGASWAMELDVSRADDGPCAVVRYPDLDCAGYWTCACSEDGRSIQAIDRITHGKERCADKVDVDITLSNDGRELVFNATTGDIQASARLER
jgi:hypothetical protein